MIRSYQGYNTGMAVLAGSVSHLNGVVFRHFAPLLLQLITPSAIIRCMYKKSVNADTLAKLD